MTIPTPPPIFQASGHQPSCPVFVAADDGKTESFDHAEGWPFDRSGELRPEGDIPPGSSARLEAIVPFLAGSGAFHPAEGPAAVMPCGHPETAAVQAGEGTAYCGACAALTAGPAATTDPLPIESTAATPGEDETRWGQADGTSWPIPGDTEWRLRYAPDTANLLHAASIVSAYAFLVDPSRSQTDAIDSLKRGRRAVSAEPRETTT